MVDSPKRREANTPLHLVDQYHGTMIRYPQGGSPSLETNPWRLLTHDDANAFMAKPISEIPADDLFIVTFAWWRDCRDAPSVRALMHRRQLTLSFLPDDDLIANAPLIDEWLAQQDESQPLGIYFPSFRDGRGFSIAATLRGRFGYRGRLMALGEVLCDQIDYMFRVGFDQVVLRHDQKPDSALRQIGRLSVRLQDDWRAQRSTINPQSLTPQSIASPIRSPLGQVALWSIPHLVFDQTHQTKLSQLYARIETILAQHSQVVFAHSLSIEDNLVSHALLKCKPQFPSTTLRFVTLDTQRLPDESYEHMDQIAAYFHIHLERLRPEKQEVQILLDRQGLNGFYESEDAKKACCGVRKMHPLQQTLAKADAWITGQRQEQSVTRSSLAFQEHEEGAPTKYNPLFDWSEHDTWAVALFLHLPVHALYQRGYPSIGCEPCTRAVRRGAPIRSGRWWWLDESQKECGLHTSISP